MERLIYGPNGEVAKRVAAATGRTVSSIYYDPDDRKAILRTTTDVEPVLDLAHAVRSELGPWSPERNFRRKCVLSVADYVRLRKDAVYEARRTGEDARSIWKRNLDRFLKENPAFRT